MSTEVLTMGVSIALIVGLFVITVAELYRHRLAAAALAAAALFAHVRLSGLVGAGGRVPGRTSEDATMGGGVATNIVAVYCSV